MEMNKKRIRMMCMLCVLAILTSAGCGKANLNIDDSNEQITDSFVGEWIVDAEYAVTRIGEENTLFVDSRGEKQAILGTIDGAIATTWQEWSITDGKAGDETWGCLKEPEAFAEVLGSLGITKDKEILFIGETTSGWGDDARLLWQLRTAGYTNMKLVDGGYEALKEAGAKKQFMASKPVAAEVEIEELDYSHVMTTEELLENYDSYKVVDVRTDEEYEGAILYGEAKGGHLPGAIHIRYTDMFKEDGTLKSNEDLVKMFEDAGLSKEDEIVTYCTGGIRSSYTQLVLEMCGFENSYNYDQSFWRWAVVGEVE